MIGKIFLGRAWHWGVLVAASVLFWLCGRQRLHVIEFNIFVLSLLTGTALVVAAVLLAHTPGERVTRDEIVASSETDTGRADAAA